jgi:hypothetical protein
VETATTKSIAERINRALLLVTQKASAIQPIRRIDPWSVTVGGYLVRMYDADAGTRVALHGRWCVWELIAGARREPISDHAEPEDAIFDAASEALRDLLDDTLTAEVG